MNFRVHDLLVKTTNPPTRGGKKKSGNKEGCAETSNKLKKPLTSNDFASALAPAPAQCFGKKLLFTQAFGQGSSAEAIGPRQCHGLRGLARHHHVFMEVLFEDQGGTRGYNHNAATTKTGEDSEAEGVRAVARNKKGAATSNKFKNSLTSNDFASALAPTPALKIATANPWPPVMAVDNDEGTRAFITPTPLALRVGT